MKFGLTAFMGMMLVIALAIPGKAGFDLSIGSISVNGTGGGFTVFATATGQPEAVTGYTLRLNLTNASAGDLPVTFAEGPGAAAGFVALDLNPNNVIAALNGSQVAGNTIGFNAFATVAVPFAQGTPVAVGTFTFTTANGFNVGDFVDVGFVFGNTADTTFSDSATPPNAIALNAIGGTNQPGNNPTVATSTRIAAVPEPSMFGLLGLVGAGLGLRRKRSAVPA